MHCYTCGFISTCLPYNGGRWNNFLTLIFNIIYVYFYLYIYILILQYFRPVYSRLLLFYTVNSAEARGSCIMLSSISQLFAIMALTRLFEIVPDPFPLLKKGQKGSRKGQKWSKNRPLTFINIRIDFEIWSNKWNNEAYSEIIPLRKSAYLYAKLTDMMFTRRPAKPLERQTDG